MSLEVWLNTIRQKFSPTEGQILVQSLQQDPLVWQFIQDDEISLPYLQLESDSFNAFAPGKMAAWLVEQSSGISLSDLTQNDFNLPNDLKARAGQAFETTRHSGLPPADLLTAGLLALTLRERRLIKQTWQGIAEEIFPNRNTHNFQKNIHTWQTPFACLFNFCPDFDDLSAELIRSKSESIARLSIPIIIHSLLANPLIPNQLMERMFALARSLSIDLQLDCLGWLKKFRRAQLQVELAQNLIQTKSNVDFIARVFSDLEAFEAVNPDIDPLEKSVRYDLPEDVNRLAAFHFYCGNGQKANETYQKSSDLLEFLKAQTLFETFMTDSSQISSSRWLEIIKLIPHSKQVRLFYVRALIDEQNFTDATKQLEELPQSNEKQLFQHQIQGIEASKLNTLIITKDTEQNSPQRPGYFIHQARLDTQPDILDLITHAEDHETSLSWLEKYIKTNYSDLQALRMTRDLYENTNQIGKAIELTAYLERAEPTISSHKHTLARLYTQAERWEDAFTFLQGLVESDPTPDIKDLERFAEAALRTDRVDITMSICQNLIKREPLNVKALVLLGESYLVKGDVVKAIQHMEGVTEMIPSQPDAWITLAWLWQQNNQTDRALETLKKGVDIIPSQPKLLRALGKTYFDKGSPSEALKPLQEAHALEPNHIEGKLDLANVQLQLGQHEEAFHLLETYIESYEKNPEAARLLGHVLTAMDKNEIAEPILLFAANHFPDDLDTVLSAARLVLTRVESSFEPEPHETLEKLENIFQKALAANPGDDQIQLHMADIVRLKGDHQKAFDAYSHLTKMGHSEKTISNWRLKYGLGQSAVGLGNLEVGLASLKTALSIQPGNLMVRHALADALQVSDLPRKADEMAKSALKLAPQDLNNILWYASFKTRSNEPDEAVRALKEALQITPGRDELKLWLAKTLISAGSLAEAGEHIRDFISSPEPDPNLLHQAAYICVHLNDLELAVQALEKALPQTTRLNATLMMDLALIYALLDQNKKALDILDVEQSLIVEHPQIAILKADLLGNMGQYELAYETLTSNEDALERLQKDGYEKSPHLNTSPLLYTHDLTPQGYHLRIGQLARALGDSEAAQRHLSTALALKPDDIKLRNASLETALVRLDFLPALEISEELDPSSFLYDQVSHDLLDLVCSQVEILLSQDANEQATAQFNKLSQAGGTYPRYLAIQSRITANLGEDAVAREHLNEAMQSYQENLGNLHTQNLPVIFRQIINLNSIAEAWLSLGEYMEAIRVWKQVTTILDTQPLFNLRFLYALITGAETQQVAETLAITAHSPGKECLSEEYYKTAEILLDNLQNFLPQDQLMCQKARFESAFTGKWPLHLNVDACLQGAEEAAACLIGSEDENLVQDILEAYPDDIRVLRAYGIYALRHNKNNAVEAVEKALKIDIANPINHALLAYLNRKQPEQALNSIETALGFWPEESEWHTLAAELYASLGNIVMAKQHINRALDAQPENAAYWQKSAILKMENNDLEQAKFDLEMSTSYQPDDPKAWANMAEVNRRLGDVPTAISNIRKANDLSPGDQILGEVELQLLFEQMNYTEAEAKAREILSIDKKNESAQIILAQALAHQGKFEQSLNTITEAIKKDPGNIRMTLEHLKIKKDMHGVEAVLPDMVTLAQNNAKDPEILTTLTDWLIQANRLDEAEGVAQTALRVLPEQPEVYLMLGRLQRLKGKLDQAITHLSNAISLKPTLVEAYIELGKTYQERRDLEKAIEIFQKGAQTSISDPRPYYYAGLALKDCKDYPGAEVMLKQAKKYSPEDANIIRQLGVVTALNLINNLREAK